MYTVLDRSNAWTYLLVSVKRGPFLSYVDWSGMCHSQVDPLRNSIKCPSTLYVLSSIFVSLSVGQEDTATNTAAANQPGTMPLLYLRTSSILILIDVMPMQ